MKYSILIAAAAAMTSAFGVDVSYTGKPEVEPIVVTNGVHSFRGQQAKNSLACRWTFDDPHNCLTDDMGGYSLLYNTSAAGIWTNENVHAGAGAVTCKANDYMKFATIPEFLRGSRPFTIMAWFYLPDTIGDVPNNAFFYMGKPGDSQAKSCVRRLLSNSTNSIAVGGHSSIAKGVTSFSGRWGHVALAYTPGTEERAATVRLRSDGIGATYTFSDKDGETNESRLGIDLEETDAFCIGAAYYATYRRLLSDKAALKCRIDQLYIFTNALDDAEIDYVREETAPTDFAAQRKLGEDGTLDLGSSTNRQDVFGSFGSLTWYGGWTVRIGSDEDRTMSGVVAGLGSIVITNAAEATLTFANANTYSGDTTVQAGTLLVQPRAEVPQELRPGLIGYWTFDDLENPGYDLSGTGNTLYPTQASPFGDPVVSDRPGGGRMMTYAFGANGTAPGGRVVWATSSTAKGLTNTVTDCGCSVTMAVWARAGADWTSTRNNRAGVVGFAYSPGTGIGFNNSAAPITAVVFGNRDINAAGSYTMTSGAEEDFHMYVLVYDVAYVDAAESNRVARFYLDGELKATKASYKHGFIACTGRFEVGGTIYSNPTSFDGDIDQAFLFNRALSDEEVAALYAFGQHPTPTGSTHSLPTSTELVVSEGASAVFDNANEMFARGQALRRCP